MRPSVPRFEGCTRRSPALFCKPKTGFVKSSQASPTRPFSGLQRRTRASDGRSDVAAWSAWPGSAALCLRLVARARAVGQPQIDA